MGSALDLKREINLILYRPESPLSSTPHLRPIKATNCNLPARGGFESECFSLP